MLCPNPKCVAGLLLILPCFPSGAPTFALCPTCEGTGHLDCSEGSQRYGNLENVKP